MIVDAPDPGAPERRVLGLGHDDRVLDRNARLVVVAVQRPGREIVARQLPRVHQLVERVLIVVAARPFLAQARDEVVGRQQRRASLIDPAPARRGDLDARVVDRAPLRAVLVQDRVGVVDVDVDRGAGSAATEIAGCRRVRRSASAPSPRRCACRAGRDQLVARPERPVEEARRRRSASACSTSGDGPAMPEKYASRGRAALADRRSRRCPRATARAAGPSRCSGSFPGAGIAVTRRSLPSPPSGCSRPSSRRRQVDLLREALAASGKGRCPR